jgi:uncharacterized membrane protein YhaH (DUF805 family)
MNTENPYQSPQVSTESSVTRPPVPQTLESILFSFEGRVPRRVYWGVTLAITFIFFAATSIVFAVFDEGSGLLTIALLLLCIPIIWISLAIQIKRWHDRDKSGYWMFINIIPYIGSIWAFIEIGCLRGTVGPNTYGADPT